MDPSVSIVVPVCNAQATLPAQVANLLEVMSDLAPCFEIVIVDDASNDETEEVAAELAKKFPQVRVAHQGLNPDTTAIMSGLATASGDVVFVLDAPTELSVSSLRQLWQLRDDEQLVMAHADQPATDHEPGIIRRLMTWGEALKDCSSEGGATVQMIRRQAVRQMGNSKTRKLIIDRGGSSHSSGMPALGIPNTLSQSTNSAVTR